LAFEHDFVGEEGTGLPGRGHKISKGKKAIKCVRAHGSAGCVWEAESRVELCRGTTGVLWER
jgi:hypothetical protein